MILGMFFLYKTGKRLATIHDPVPADVTVVLEEWHPLARAGIWAGAGIIAVIFAFAKTGLDWIGFAAISATLSVWIVAYLAQGYVDSAENLIWFLFIMLVIAGWPGESKDEKKSGENEAKDGSP